MPKQARDAFGLLLVVVVSLLTADWLLRRALAAPGGENPPWTAIMTILTAVVALLIWQTPANAPPFPKVLPGVTPLSPSFSPSRLLLGLAAGVCLSYALLAIPKLRADESYLLVTAAWLLAVALWLTAVLPWQLPAMKWPQRRPQLLPLVALAALALCLRLWRLETIPFALGGDEASQGLEAVRVLNGTLRSPLTTGWLGVPTMGFFYNSVTIALFGRTIFGLRLAWVLVGTLNVLVTFFLVRRLAATATIGWLTAVLLATYHYHIHFSRLGSHQIADPLFLSLALWFLIRALDDGKRSDWALTGLVCGLAFYFYAGARLTPVIVVAVLAYRLLRAPRVFWQKHHIGLFLLLGTFLFVAAPMVQYAIRFPDDFNARPNMVGIFQSGWLAREVAARQEGYAPILWDQFRRAALAFNYYPDRTVWYGLKGPLLDPFFGALFLLGLLFSTLQLLWWRAERPLAPMVAWWWGGMLLGGMLTDNPPSSQRLITLAVPTCFFIALALWEIGQLGKRALSALPVNLFLMVATASFAFISLDTYFARAVPQRLYGGHHAELATELVPRLRALQADHRFYFVGAPWMYWSFATLPYLMPNAEAMDIGEPPASAPTSRDLLGNGKGVAYIFLPERMAELAPVQQALPQGTAEEIVSPASGRSMATLYIVDNANRRD